MVGIFTITQQPSATDFFVYPNADVPGCTEHTKFGDTPNYANIDELKDAPDEDGTYNYNDTANVYIDLFDLPNDVKSGVINYIQVFARAKSHEYPQSPSGIYKIAVSPSSTCTDYYLSPDIDLINNYSTYSMVWTKNPLLDSAWLWSVFATDMAIGYQSNSPEIIHEKNLTLRPQSEGTYCGLEGQACANCGTGNHQVCVIDFDNKYASSINLETGCPGADGTWATDTFNLPNPDVGFHNGTISKISIVARMGKTGNCDGIGWIVAILSDGATYEYPTVNLPHAFDIGWGWFTQDMVVHPTTGLPLTWWDINGLEIGYKLQTLCHDYGEGSEVCFRSYCNQIYLLIYFKQPDNPEIRTTQCYMKANYTPPTDTCYLNKPNKIDNNHSRNIKMLNFWSGNREVYDLNRSGKSMLLTGTEFYNPDCTDVCARIDCVRMMGLNHVKVSITDLGDTIWNGDYFIRSFNWKKIKSCPEWYSWALDLEDTRHVMVGDGYE